MRRGRAGGREVVLYLRCPECLGSVRDRSHLFPFRAPPPIQISRQPNPASLDPVPAMLTSFLAHTLHGRNEVDVPGMGPLSSSLESCSRVHVRLGSDARCAFTGLCCVRRLTEPPAKYSAQLTLRTASRINGSWKEQKRVCVGRSIRRIGGLGAGSPCSSSRLKRPRARKTETLVARDIADPGILRS
jgi:hypothetical protein